MRAFLNTGALLLIAVATLAQVSRPPLKVGDKAPDFSLPNGDEKQVKLSDYTARGPVVLVFYRGFW
jgi:peroxiredoxin